MGELTEAIELAKHLLEDPTVDPDDHQRLLSRQLLCRQEVVEWLQDILATMCDGTLDLTNANRDLILRKHEEAVVRVRRCLRSGDCVLAERVLDALDQFHPMYGESWPGWPKESDP